MKIVRITTLILFGLLAFRSQAQLVMQVQMDDSIEGICDHANVYALYGGFDQQIEPECSLSKEQMEEILNRKLQFLKENPKFKSKGMIGVFINCEGTTVKWDVALKSKSAELDQQILEIFQTFDEWTAGKLNGKAVDTRELFSYEIKKGMLKIN
jgi:hypothetical protein